MLYFFHNQILLLLFDTLRTVPVRLSTKLTTIAVIPNTLQHGRNLVGGHGGRVPPLFQTGGT